MPAHWDPSRLLQIEGYGRGEIQCVGRAASRGDKRCRWAAAETDEAIATIRSLTSTMEMQPPSEVSKDQLRSLAKLCLCSGFHQGQVYQVSEWWWGVVEEAERRDLALRGVGGNCEMKNGEVKQVKGVVEWRMEDREKCYMALGEVSACDVPLQTLIVAWQLTQARKQQVLLRAMKRISLGLDDISSAGAMQIYTNNNNTNSVNHANSLDSTSTIPTQPRTTTEAQPFDDLIKDAEQKLKISQQKFTEANTQIETLRDEKAQYQDTVEELRRQLREAVGEVDGRSNLEVVEEELETARKELRATREEVEMVQADLTTTQTDLTKSRENFAATRTELSSTQSTLSTTEKQVQKAQAELSTTQSQLSATQKELSAAKSESSQVPILQEALRRLRADRSTRWLYRLQMWFGGMRSALLGLMGGVAAWRPVGNGK